MYKFFSISPAATVGNCSVPVESFFCVFLLEFEVLMKFLDGGKIFRAWLFFNSRWRPKVTPKSKILHISAHNYNNDLILVSNTGFSGTADTIN